jgi:hypothetical protein
MSIEPYLRRPLYQSGSAICVQVAIAFKCLVTGSPVVAGRLIQIAAALSLDVLVVEAVDPTDKGVPSINTWCQTTSPKIVSPTSIRWRSRRAEVLNSDKVHG